MIKITSTVNGRLTTKFVNYNCGTRLAGRLAMEFNHDGKNVDKLHNYGTYLDLMDKCKGKEEQLIREFVASLNVRETYGPLNVNNPIFKDDVGQYIPTCILVPDSIYRQGNSPIDSWRNLIHEFQTNYKEWGVKVMPGPLFHNGIYNSPHLSRIWALVPPVRSACILDKFKGFLFSQGEAHLSKFGNVLSPESMFPEDLEEIRNIIGAV